MFSGPFTITHNRLQGVDFSSPVFVDYWGLVIPLRIKDSLLSILNPFSTDVWIILFLSIPLYIVAMAISDYTASGQFNWVKSAGLVIRIALHADIRQPTESGFFPKRFE